MEAHAVVGFHGRAFVDHDQGIVVVDYCLQSLAPNEGSAQASAQIATINEAGTPGGQIAVFESVGKNKIAGAGSVARSQRVCRSGRQGCSSSPGDRKSTRLNSSHGYISYAVF